jgi:hypothetical protein
VEESTVAGILGLGGTKAGKVGAAPNVYTWTGMRKSWMRKSWGSNMSGEVVEV